MLVILFFCLFSNNSNSFNSEYKTKNDNLVLNTYVFNIKPRENKNNVFDYLPLVSPIKTKYLVKISDMFGWRKNHPILHIPCMHNGIDFTADYGTPVYATASGIIKIANFNKWGYGRQVVIQHDSIFKTRYAHLSKVIVKEGDIIKVGQKIGEVGSTGLSTAPHLHYELIKNDIAINPLNIYNENLNKDEYLSLLIELERSNEQRVKENNYLDKINPELLADGSINQKK